MKIRKTKLTNYSYIHEWNQKNHPKTGICVTCNVAGKTEWALKQGKEHARGIKNYLELCIKCHRNYDRQGRPAWNKGKRTYRKCEFCQKDFYPRRKSSQFCSNSCSAKGLNKAKSIMVRVE